jgi:hypothetical protein
MIKIIKVLCLFSFFILASCQASADQDTYAEHSLLLVIANVIKMSSDDTLVLSGESENWELVLIVSPDEVEKEHVMIISYRGEKKTNKSIGWYSVYFPGGGKIEGGSSLSGNGLTSVHGCCFSNISSETVIKAVVEWDGKEEEIELINKSIETYFDHNN